MFNVATELCSPFDFKKRRFYIAIIRPYFNGVPGSPYPKALAKTLFVCVYIYIYIYIYI